MLLYTGSSNPILNYLSKALYETSLPAFAPISRFLIKFFMIQTSNRIFNLRLPTSHWLWVHVWINNLNKSTVVHRIWQIKTFYPYRSGFVQCTFVLGLVCTQRIWQIKTFYPYGSGFVQCTFVLGLVCLQIIVSFESMVLTTVLFQ